MKKFIAAVLLVSLLAAFFGCGADTQSTAITAAQATKEVTVLSTAESETTQETIAQPTTEVTTQPTTSTTAAPTTKKTTTAAPTTKKTTTAAPTTKKTTTAAPATKRAVVADNEIDNSRIVYITKTGECYHYENPCGNGKYYPITLNEAISQGYRPCKKCVL